MGEIGSRREQARKAEGLVSLIRVILGREPDEKFVWRGNSLEGENMIPDGQSQVAARIARLEKEIRRLRLAFVVLFGLGAGAVLVAQAGKDEKRMEAHAFSVTGKDGEQRALLGGSPATLVFTNKDGISVLSMGQMLTRTATGESTQGGGLFLLNNENGANLVEIGVDPANGNPSLRLNDKEGKVLFKAP